MQCSFRNQVHLISFGFLGNYWRLNLSLIVDYISVSVLLEGSPGVGKTSLIMALGKYSGHKVVRINLSEQVWILHQPSILCMLLCLFGNITSVHLIQTDMMDLLGSDLPVESDEDMKFDWSDGILLQVKNV